MIPYKLLKELSRPILLVSILIALGGGCATPNIPKIEDYLSEGQDPPPQIQMDMEKKIPREVRLGSAGNSALTLDKSVRIALDRNPRYRAAQEGIAIAREEVGLARAPYYPSLSLEGSYSRWQSRAFLPDGIGGDDPPTTVGPTNDWSGGVKASWMLFDSGARAARLRAALAGEGIADYQTEQVRQDLALEVHRGFYAVVSAQEAVTVARQNLSRTENHLQIARQQEEAGAVPPADVLRAKVEVADARLSLVKAESQVRLSRGGLNTAMGLPVETEVALESPAGNITDEEEINLAEALDEALQARPEINAALQRVGASRGSVDLAKSAFGPRVQAAARYGRRDVDFFPDDEDWSVGLALEWPLFEGFFRTHNLSREKYKLSREESEVRHLLLKVREEVWSAYQKMREARESLSATEALVTDAQESMRQTRERYQVGAGTTTDLLDAQTTLARAELIAVDSRWQYHNSNATFKYAVGSLLSPIDE